MSGRRDLAQGHDPNSAIVDVENYVLATSQISDNFEERPRPEKDLDDLLTSRDAINEELQTIIDDHTGPWSMKISLVEAKAVEIPHQMRWTMARQAENESEYQASQRSCQAVGRLESPPALQMRLLPDADGDLQREHLHSDPRKLEWEPKQLHWLWPCPIGASDEYAAQERRSKVPL